MAERKPTLQEFTEWVSKRCLNITSDTDAMEKFLQTDRALEEIEQRYNSAIRKYESGKITYKVLQNGSVNSVAYCLDLML